MFLKNRDQVPAVDWGNGTSFRLVNKDENLGFGVAHTIVRAGTVSKLKYDSHLEACYCISGKGRVLSADGDTELIITPGVLYGLDNNDAHTLCADEDSDMHLISVFSPALEGHERHELSDDEYSSY
ncbi:L-ectoine synthase [Arthrobacter sp. MYb23]|uniref:ectoine synthase n=1 Tax=unclassified Arthrobacter TaxID=235627 RepID=UPI000CFC37C8|nr:MULTISPECIES: ectoine synthase [unclassified Arthrobacter]PRB38744.1 L-ectoine synthase [Arthrobacter sp. MYb51]PRB91573.1 L-ectoine synthase [Arthrobacter sp. MYb23]